MLEKATFMPISHKINIFKYIHCIEQRLFMPTSSVHELVGHRPLGIKMQSTDVAIRDSVRGYLKRWAITSYYRTD